MTIKTWVAATLAPFILPGAAFAEQYRLGLITPPSHQWTISAQSVADRLREETQGRVDILVFPSGQLGSESQMLQQLQTGAIDFAWLTVGEFANRDPNYGIFLAPYIAPDIEAARRLLSGPTAQELLDGVEDFGLTGFGWGTAGMRQIVMAGAVTTVGDLSGRKIRTVPLEPELAFWQSVGAAPTPMPLPALYDAFANGQIDGMQIDFEGTWNSSYHALAGTIIHSDHMMFPMLAVGSARVWANIPESDQAAIQAIMSEEIDRMIGIYGELDAQYLANLEGTAVPIIHVDREWFGPAIDAWYESWRERAPMLVGLETEAAN